MATEKRLIDANALMGHIGEEYDLNYGEIQTDPIKFFQMVEDAPTVDAVEVVHGQWVSDKADILFHCSVCETQISTDWDYDDLYWNYCPNCGAKMDGDGNA